MVQEYPNLQAIENSPLRKRAKELPFWQWAEETSLWIDREYFTYEGFVHLKPIYESFPQEPKDFPGFQLVIMKAAQGGGSVILLLWNIYLMLRFDLNIGYYLPDQTTAMEFSDLRFMKMIRSNPELLEMMRDPFGHHDEGRKIVRKVGTSLIMFLWTGMNTGPTTNRTTMRTEAMPLDALTFDEVQGMTRPQIEKTEERLSASRLKIITKVSTPRWPETDIHYEFSRTKQYFWHSDCKCPDGVVLTDDWPNCIAQENGRIFYVCQHCKTEIVNPQQGRYIAHNPSSSVPGYTFSQIISSRVSPKEMWEAWLRAADKQNFYNRKLGIPYADPSQIPINLEILKNNLYASFLEWKKGPGRYFMGIDHMGALNVHVIKRIDPVRGEIIVHLDWTESDDPFKRSAALMKEWDIEICTLESLPNYNEAFRFAKAFPGKVFVAEYSAAALKGEMLRWQDREKTEPAAVRKTTDEARQKYGVTLDQYKFMAFSLGKIQKGKVKMPHPDEKPLMAERLIHGQMTPDNLSALFCKHLTKIALRVEKEEQETTYSTEVVKIGIEDPHFSFANFCCDVSIARAYGTTRLITSEIEMEEKDRQEAGETESAVMEQIRKRIPMTGQIVRETCISCLNYKPIDGKPDQGKCQGVRYKNVQVAASDVRCDEYEEEQPQY